MRKRFSNGARRQCSSPRIFPRIYSGAVYTSYPLGFNFRISIVASHIPVALLSWNLLAVGFEADRVRLTGSSSGKLIQRRPPFAFGRFIKQRPKTAVCREKQ